MIVCLLLLQDKDLYNFALYRTTKQGFPISDMWTVTMQELIYAGPLNPFHIVLFLQTVVTWKTKVMGHNKMDLRQISFRKRIKAIQDCV